MKISYSFLMSALVCILLLSSVSAWDPRDNITLRDRYSITGGVNIEAQNFCNATSCYTISDFLVGNVYYADGEYIYLNDSNYFILNDTRLNQTIDDRDSDTTYTAGSNMSLIGTIFSVDMPSVKTYFDLIYAAIGDVFSGVYADLTGKPTVLSNFTDDLGDRGYTSNLNFTNDAGYYNSTSFPDNYLRNDGDTATGNYNFDSNTFFIDSSSNEVGIGTATPEARLHVYYPTTGDVIFQEGTGDGGSDMRTLFGYNGYGWYYKYLGSGSADNNEWQLWSEGAGSTDQQVYAIKQSGNFQFLKLLSLATGPQVNDIDTTVADSDTALATSGAVYDGLAAQDSCSEITNCVPNAWDSISDVPTATPSNGDTTHLSTADQIFDFVIGLGYATTSWVTTQLSGYVQTSNLVSLVGNWSDDKGDYSTTSEANALYRSESWDNFTGVPTATPSNGDTTHLSTADQIYDFIIGLGYATTSWVTTQLSDYVQTSNLVSLIGNWSQDKSDYWNMSEAVDASVNIVTTGQVGGSSVYATGATAPTLKAYLTDPTSYAGIGASNSMVQDVGFAILSYGSSYAGSAFGVPKVNLTRFYTYGSQLVMGTWQEHNVTIGTNDTAAIVIDTDQKTHFQEEVVMGDNNMTGVQCVTFTSGGKICSGS